MGVEEGPVDYWTLAQTVGVPLAMVLTALIAGYQRRWVWGTELVACEDRAAKQAAAYEARLEAQRAAHLTRESEMAAAAQKWQTLLFATIPALKGLTEAVDSQVKRGG